MEAVSLDWGGLTSSSPRQDAWHLEEQHVESCLVGDPWVSWGMCHLDATVVWAISVLEVFVWGTENHSCFFKIEIRSRICFFFLADSGTFPTWLLSAVWRVEALAGRGELLPPVLKMNYEDANSSFGSTVWQITDAGYWRTRSRLFSAAVSLGISKRERHAVWCFHVTLQQVTLLECSSAAVPPK